ncbi:MAG TPA: hypothetical protein VGK47_14790 [Nitrososphaeraceae archaeon]
MTFTHALSTNNFGCAKFIVDGSAANGTHTTIASAITAASSGETIFIRPGTYTENLTLKAGVNLCAYVCDSSQNATGHVIINGTCSMTTAGTVTISGIQLQTNSAALLAVTGSAASIVELVDCYLNMSNNTGITFSSSSSSSAIRFRVCRGNLGTTGIAIFSHSAAGNLNINTTIISNSGGSSTANTCSSGSVTSINSFLSNPITMSSTGTVTCKYSEIDTSAINTTCLTTVTGTNLLEFCRLSSGTATPLSVGGTVMANSLLLNHTNATAVTGSGTIIYSSIFQDSTVGTISASTNTGKSIDAGSISFNQETAALSTYAIGTWTPTITGSTGNPTPTYVTQEGNYVKIGRMVFIQFRIEVSALTGGTGNIQVSGLPFTVANFTGSQPFAGFTTISGNRSISIFQANTNTTLATVQIDGGIGNLALPQTTLTFLIGSGSYMATS